MSISRTASPKLVIDVVGLRKSFGDQLALDGLDLRVEAGQIAGFLGPNGSGKSTTLQVLMGRLRAEATTVRVLDADPWRDAVALNHRIAYVPAEVSLWPNVTGGQAIDILSGLRGGVSKARRDELLQRFELDPSKKACTYSTGNRQKVALVAALASNAELLILDEPSPGLDPAMEAAFRLSLREAKAAGRSVLLASHIYAEVENLCDTVTFIRNGRTVESGTPAELHHLQRTTISVILDGATANLALVPGVHDLLAEGGRNIFTVSDADLGQVLAALAHMKPRALVASPPSLEDLFLRHTCTEQVVDGVGLP